MPVRQFLNVCFVEAPKVSRKWRLRRRRLLERTYRNIWRTLSKKCLKMSNVETGLFLITSTLRTLQMLLILFSGPALFYPWSEIPWLKKTRHIEDIFKSILQQQTQLTAKQKWQIICCRLECSFSIISVRFSTQIKRLHPVTGSYQHNRGGTVTYPCSRHLRLSRWRRSWAGELLLQPSPSHTLEGCQFWCHIHAGFV